MKKIILFSFLLFNLFLVQPDSAMACSCIMPAPPLESMENSEAVFSGRVSNLNPTDMSIKVDFEVSKVWKGDLNQKTTLTTALDSAACGYYFEEGKEYLIYAYQTEEGGLATGLCSRTALLADAQDDLTALGEGRAPSDYNLGDENPALDASSDSYLALYVSIGVIVILIIILAARQRKK